MQYIPQHGLQISLAEAKRRNKYWCVRGQRIPDELGATNSHMDDKPRMYIDVPSDAELDRDVV